jgi:hypothetical protein
VEPLFEVLDAKIDTKELRTRVRTGFGEFMSRLALITPPQNELISGDYERIYFHHVRKTAGTSIVFAFFSLSGSDPRNIERMLYWCSFARLGGMRFVEHNATLIQRGRYFFAASHFPSYVALPPKDGTFAFTALRDPVKRVASLYRYLKSENADEGFTFRAQPMERSWASGSFDQFLDVLPREELLQQLFMFSPTGDVSETVDTLGKLDLVMHTEEIQKGVAQLEALTGIKLDVGHKRSTPSDSQTIPEHALERARSMLSSEYEMLRQLSSSHSLGDLGPHGE